MWNRIIWYLLFFEYAFIYLFLNKFFTSIHFEHLLFLVVFGSKRMMLKKKKKNGVNGLKRNEQRYEETERQIEWVMKIQIIWTIYKNKSIKSIQCKTKPDYL